MMHGLERGVDAFLAIDRNEALADELKREMDNSTLIECLNGGSNLAFSVCVDV